MRGRERWRCCCMWGREGVGRRGREEAISARYMLICWLLPWNNPPSYSLSWSPIPLIRYALELYTIHSSLYKPQIPQLSITTVLYQQQFMIPPSPLLPAPSSYTPPLKTPSPTSFPTSQPRASLACKSRPIRSSSHIKTHFLPLPYLPP